MKKLCIALVVAVSAPAAFAGPAKRDMPAASAKVVEGNVTVQSAADLKKLEGVETVKGSLMIENLHDATDLSSLRSLNTVGGIFVIMNTDLASLAGLEHLGWVQGTFSIMSNPKLSSIAALSSVQTVYNNFEIDDNAALVQLPAKGFRLGEPTKGTKGGLVIRKNGKLAKSAVDAFVNACTVSGKNQIEQ